MIKILKRYGMAIFFLLLVSFLMLIGTLGVKDFGESMLKEVNVEMKPQGEVINR